MEIGEIVPPNKRAPTGFYTFSSFAIYHTNKHWMTLFDSETLNHEMTPTYPSKLKYLGPLPEEYIK